MYLKSKQLILTVFFILVSFSFSITPVFATEAFNKSLQEAGKGTGHTPVDGDQAANYFYSTIGNAISILLSLVGIVFIVLIIYAGYTWMLARGDEAEAAKAKSTITRAIIGLFIVMSAYAITALVGNSF